MKLEMAQGSFGGFKWLSHYYLMDDSTLDWTRIGGLSGQGNYPGTYLETRNWRIPSFEDLDSDLKPMRMTGTVAGFEYQAAPDHVVSFRYTRKNLDRAIEDVGRQTPAGEAYYITNPGRGLSVDRFETRSLEINLNVINLFNPMTPLRTYRSLYRQSLPLWQPGDPVSQVLDGYDYQAIAVSQGATRDPRFLQHDRFLDPISARFGIRFVF